MTSYNGIEKHLIACHWYVLVGRGCDHTPWNIIVTLYKGFVATSPKSMWHSHDFNGRSETNQKVMSHNVMLHHYLAWPALLRQTAPSRNADHTPSESIHHPCSSHSSPLSMNLGITSGAYSNRTMPRDQSSWSGPACPEPPPPFFGNLR